MVAYCPPRHWKTQLPVDYLDTTLTADTWETVSADLSEGAPVQLFFVILEQTNNGATAEDLELEITINGTAYTFSVTADSGVQQFCYFYWALLTGDFNPLVSTTAYPFGSVGKSSALGIPFYGDSVGLIRVKQTSGVDAVSAQIEVNIVWAKKV